MSLKQNPYSYMVKSPTDQDIKQKTEADPRNSGGMSQRKTLALVRENMALNTAF